MKGKRKYMKYFNSDLVSEYIIDKTLDRKSNNKNFWKNNEKNSFNIWNNRTRWFVFS